MVHLGRPAIVIGASIGGLLTVRALADHHEEVTVVERYMLPEARAAQRRAARTPRARAGLSQHQPQVLDSE